MWYAARWSDLGGEQTPRSFKVASGTEDWPTLVVDKPQNSLAKGARHPFRPITSKLLPKRHQCGVGSGGTGIGMSVVIFHPCAVWIQTRTMTNGLGTGFWPP